MVLHFEMPGCMYVCVESVFVCSSVHACAYVCVCMVFDCVCIYRIVLILRPVFVQVRVCMCVFVCVKNMSRCVKYHKPGQGVGVGFCHSCHSVKMRQKHLGLLESSRGPPDHVQTDTCLVSDHTYRWGPFVLNDFSNLTNILSPTPEL